MLKVLIIQETVDKTEWLIDSFNSMQTKSLFVQTEKCCVLGKVQLLNLNTFSFFLHALLPFALFAEIMCLKECISILVQVQLFRSDLAEL